MRSAIVAALVVLTASVALAEDPVFFPDENLEIAVESALVISDPTPSQMDGLEFLSAGNLHISLLTGLEHAEFLTLLSMPSNQIGDISPVSGLSRLAHLLLHENQINDILPVAGLTSLQSLSLGDNQISNISPAAGLTKLETLSLHDNQISDISALSGLIGLRSLSLSDNQISDISDLVDLTNLDTLHLSGNPLNQDAYNIHIPQIIDNNPGIDITYDSIPIPEPSSVTLLLLGALSLFGYKMHRRRRRPSDGFGDPQ